MTEPDSDHIGEITDELKEKVLLSILKNKFHQDTGDCGDSEARLALPAFGSEVRDCLRDEPSQCDVDVVSGANGQPATLCDTQTKIGVHATTKSEIRTATAESEAHASPRSVDHEVRLRDSAASAESASVAPIESENAGSAEAEKADPAKSEKSASAEAENAKPAKSENSISAKAEKADPAESGNSALAEAKNAEPAKSENSMSAEAGNAEPANSENSVPVESENQASAESETPARAGSGDEVPEGSSPKVDRIKKNEEKLAAEESSLSDAQLTERHKESQSLKARANSLYQESAFGEAAAKYSEALDICPLREAKDRAVLHANRAAALMAAQQNKEALPDLDRALELDANYLKALERRARLNKQLENLDDSLKDYERLLELVPKHYAYIAANRELKEQIKARDAELKAKMIDSLKQLGNVFLKPFGLSTENFSMVPNEGGGYNLQMKGQQ